ncbi:MAG: YidC/Oxa1 family membrane protein insertase, partial [Clostridiales bacterium]
LALFIFTLILKLLLQPLMNKQLRSTRVMQRLTPQVNELKRRYASDQVKQNQKIMELYKENNASPTSGCLPLLLQMPILIALFEALRNFVPAHPEAYTFFWIPNLSEADPTGFVLPLLAAAATFFQQKVSTVNSTDRTQKMMLYIFPVMFFVMVRNFPAGLAFYWIFYSLIGAAIMIPLKRKWAVEDKKFAEEEEARKETELAAKKAKQAAAAAKKKKNAPKHAPKPMYQTEDSDMIVDFSSEFEPDELDFEAEPEEGEDIYHWLAHRGIRVKRKKMKLHPYSLEEEVIETCIMPDGKQLDISILQKEYQAMTAEPVTPPDFKTLLGMGKKKPGQDGAAGEEKMIAAQAEEQKSEFSDVDADGQHNMTNENNEKTVSDGENVDKPAAQDKE